MFFYDVYKYRKMEAFQIWGDISAFRENQAHPFGGCGNFIKPSFKSCCSSMPRIDALAL